MPFYPVSAPVPEERRTTRLWLRPLKASDAELDYYAVMSSAEMLHRWTQSDWPPEDFTLERNRSDLEYHERQHLGRQAFTYTVLDPQGSYCLGCVYLQPPHPEETSLFGEGNYAVDVGFWVRASELAADLDRHLLDTLLDWFRDEWVFDRVLFTIVQKEARQAALLEAAGLKRLLTCTLLDGRPCWVYG